MNAILIYSSATVLGIGTGMVTALGVYRRLTVRLSAKSSHDATSRDLEKRRDRHLSGRTEDAREKAGPPAHLDSLFPITQLGSLAQRKKGQNIDRA